MYHECFPFAHSIGFKICVNLDTIACFSVIFKLDFSIGSFILSRPGFFIFIKIV